jgi:hypothetical protein
MTQSNYNIPNDSAPAVRAQLNAVFGSIATNNSGSSAPATTFPHQWWYDTTTNILKQRNAADSAWINIGTFDQTGGTFTPAGTPQLTQTQAEDPASTVFGTVSGQRLAQAVAGRAAGALGTYAYCRTQEVFGPLSEAPLGTTFSGSALLFSPDDSINPAGTWMVMGHLSAVVSGAGNAAGRRSLFRRIS